MRLREESRAREAKDKRERAEREEKEARQRSERLAKELKGREWVWGVNGEVNKGFDRAFFPALRISDFGHLQRRGSALQCAINDEQGKRERCCYALDRTAAKLDRTSVFPDVDSDKCDTITLLYCKYVHTTGFLERSFCESSAVLFDILVA